MVLPVPGGRMGAPMLGPPPPEVQPRFQVLKHSLIALLVAFAIRILSWFATIERPRILTSALNLLLNIVVGIFLFSDDPDFKPAHEFMLNTCCQGCQEQCPYGLGCLTTFVLVNFIDLLWSIIFMEPLEWATNPTGARNPTTTGGTGQVAGKPLVQQSPSSQWAGPTYVGNILFVASAIITMVAQFVIVYQGWKVFQQINSSGVSSLPGDADRYPADRQGASGRSNWGAGSWGGSAGRAANDDGDAERPARTGRPQQSFEVFGGEGHRLGGE